MSSRPISASRITTTSSRPNAPTIAAALTAGLFLRLWFIVHTGHVSGDSLLYGDIAKSWLDHGIYGFSQNIGLPQPTLIRLPGYPLFLAICFVFFGHEHYHAVMYAQVALDLATCLLIAALAGRLFGHRASLAALWLSVLCPFTASYVSAPLTETPTLATIALAFYALDRWQEAAFGSREAGSPYNRWLYILAAALSYSILLRPEQGLLAAAILPVMLWIALSASLPANRVRSATPILLTAVLVILPFAPWTLRNWHTFHVIQPLAPRYATDPGESVPYGFQRWFRTWGIDFVSTDNVYWNYNGSTIAISDLPSRAFDSASQYAASEALLADYNQATNASPAFDARFADIARERVAAHPFRYYVALPVARMLNMAFRPRTEMFNVYDEWWKYRRHPGQTIFSAAYATLNLAYFVLAAIGLRRWRTLNTTRPSWLGLPALAWAMIASIALRSALLLTLDNSEPRYTLEFFPVLIVFAAALFTQQTPKRDQ